MFEDALMESGGRIRTHRTWFSGVAAICNCGIACLLVVLPLLHPASLPRQTLSTLLAAPAPPAPPLPHMPRVVSTARAAAFADPFTPPKLIPNSIASADRESPSPLDMGLVPLARGSGSSFTGLPDSIGAAGLPQVRAARSSKLTISSGVMQGQKLSGVDPRYPAIAIATHVQGTVVLAATISRTGTIENLRIVSGSPMLTPAAEDAVRTWRYRPYLLNGEPVQVETTVNVVFRLGD
jgi:protein TonB